MDTAEFLRHVLPERGPYCIVARKKNGAIWHFPADDIDEAASISKTQADDGMDVYFAVGALHRASQWDAGFVNREGDVVGRWFTSRSGDNIRGLRTYTADIDAGNGRAYASVEGAIRALRTACTDAGLPRPTIVQ